MLEPAVRPGQAPTSARPASSGDEAAAPFESKSFDELFRELSEAPPNGARESRDDDESQASSTQPRTDPLAPLQTVENASLTRLLADRPDDRAHASADAEIDRNRAA
jgi:hypothetical protein